MKGLLTNDHRELGILLEQLFASFDTGVAISVYEKLDVFWARLAMHIRAEHLHLFPAILNVVESKNTEAEKGIVPHIESTRKTIKNLHDDHDFFMRELAVAVKQMRNICESENPNNAEKLQPVREIVTNVSQRLKSHNQVEEMLVYRWAENLLLPAECWVLDEQILNELEKLPPRLREN